MSKDVVCPTCKSLVSFKNAVFFDERKVEIMGIAYMLHCLKCDCVFVSDVRFSKKASAKQMKDMEKVFMKVKR